MNGFEQAARVRLAAAAVIATGDPADVAFDLDRRDLARLLAAIGDAWGAAERRSVPLAERLRWSTACAVANRVAERWENEAALAGHSAPESPEMANLAGTVLDFLRRKTP